MSAPNTKEAGVCGESRDCSEIVLWGGREKEERAGGRTLGGSGDDTVRARKSPAVAVLAPDPFESDETDELPSFAGCISGRRR